jgi:hypothetical protein
VPRVNLRCQERFSIQAPAFISWSKRGGSRKKKREGATRNISSMGIYIVAELGPRPGSTLSFDVLLPPMKKSGPALHIKGRGRILRVDSIAGNSAIRGFAILNQELLIAER